MSNINPPKDHNRPPMLTIDALSVDYQRYVNQVADLEAVILELPGRIELDNKAAYDHWADTVSNLDKVAKAIEATRVSVKEPFLTAERTCDGFFNSLQTQLGRTRAAMSSVLKDYLSRKAAAERAIREEAARKAREEEDLKRAEAAEAARRAQALENQRRATAAAEKRVEASIATQEAITANVAAAAAAKAAAAKTADLARTRSDSGTLGTLADKWTFEVTDPMALPADVLWPYIPAAAKESALRAFVKAGGRSIAGARIFNDKELRVRG